MSSTTEQASRGDAWSAAQTGGARVAENAANFSDDLAGDVRKLRDDIGAIQKTLAQFISTTAGEAARTAQNVGASVTSQVSDIASEAASVATQQAKTFASELEGMARRNPLGTIGGAVLVGVVIGLLSRGRS
ncbi:DUF883 family protein [Pseudolabrys taiwanensis]|uniref:DUF883 family protein n=1 Tax=Pseudolabrys taiwanensis TaxID=331696 RepID=A0A346A2B0_9HYPH|nr:DUF883 family protein [Pseudolabrys taiwanensis]AXK83307.1 DUF883 family protein [Pseudolabrys taiwanensis]